MQRITADHPHPLFDTAATRRIETAAAAALPPHALMQRAGRAVAQLAQALAPHARRIWIACGPGNNGGDGLEAAVHLQRSGYAVAVTWLGQPDRCPPDARAAWQRAQAAGLDRSTTPPAALGPQDLCIDALLGLGASSAPQPNPRTPDARLLACLQALRHSPATVLAVDLPSGLDADTGQFAPGLEPEASPPPTAGPRHTLSLLTLKPGLFTAAGRDAAGTVWLDVLDAAATEAPSAWLQGPPAPQHRAHASHKGSYGDVAIVGGEGLAARGMGMTGAALLAASAALHSGAGRVMVCLMDDEHPAAASALPELMLRRFDALALAELSVVCGCGGGQAVVPRLPAVLARSARLVLDADALNAVAADAALQSLLTARAAQGLPTVITPHPLEAARLLGTTTAVVQADRLAAARALALRFGCVVVLKGSGTVVAAPDGAASLNPTGNALLATGGTGDVLAGMVGAGLARGLGAMAAARAAVYRHGLAADVWPAGAPLTAGALARRVGG
ncbi:NAD(P)H-hydrate dehydratase [Acidovorax lacteus]|uniref:Bifunctional NAD(P)H-hydrate repair enzyme n=1 Tax=Acidovorax lacteus TaxID=1924988 RepID=A0ABP8L1I5_9BURK